MKVEIDTSIWQRKDLGRDKHWTRYEHLGRTFIFIVCTLPAKESGRLFHLGKSYFTFVVRAVTTFSILERAGASDVDSKIFKPCV